MLIQNKRPRGVTILAAITLAAGLMQTLAGLLFAGVSVLLFSLMGNAPVLIGSEFDSSTDYSFSLLTLGSLMTIVAFASLAIGIAGTVIGVGMFKGWTWTWFANVVLTAVSIGMLSFSIVTLEDASVTLAYLIFLAAEGFIMVYLFKPNVKEFFNTMKLSPESFSNEDEQSDA